MVVCVHVCMSVGNHFVTRQSFTFRYAIPLQCGLCKIFSKYTNLNKCQGTDSLLSNPAAVLLPLYTHLSTYMYINICNLVFRPPIPLFSRIGYLSFGRWFVGSPCANRLVACYKSVLVTSPQTHTHTHTLPQVHARLCV